MSEPESLLRIGGCFLLFFFFALGVAGVASIIAAVISYARRSGRARQEEVATAHRRYALAAHGSSAVLSVIVVVATWVALLGWAVRTGPLGFVALFALCLVLVLMTQMVASNWLALLGNRQLRANFLEHNPKGGEFVGVCDPQNKSFYNQIVDTHDDFGLLRLEEDALAFDGAQSSMSVRRDAIRELRRPMVWQFAYLGSRWLEIHWTDVEGRRILRIESREKGTILANGRATAELHDRLVAWSGRGGGSAPPA